MTTPEIINQVGPFYVATSGSLLHVRSHELSEHLAVPKATIYSWVRRGDIPFVKLGGVVRFDPEEINDWLRERKHPVRKKLLFLREASSKG